MNTTQHQVVTPEKRLGILAMEFRATKDRAARKKIAEAYSLAVAQLIESGKWEEIPPMEDQLPDDWMPEAFFRHWSLTPPPRRAAK
jgi:hypothetical protein